MFVLQLCDLSMQHKSVKIYQNESNKKDVWHFSYSQIWIDLTSCYQFKKDYTNSSHSLFTLLLFEKKKSKVAAVVPQDYRADSFHRLWLILNIPPGIVNYSDLFIFMN